MSDALKLRIDLFKNLNPDTTLSFNSFVLDGSTDECAMAFAVEKAIIITQIGFRVNAVTGTPGELTVSLNSLTGTTGEPSATILGGGSPASLVIASPSGTFTAGQVYWATLANAYTATASEMMALKIDPTAGTWDASNSVSISLSIVGFAARSGSPYALQAPSGVYARISGYPVFGIRSASDTQGCPIETITATTFDSATNPNQYGFAFTLPSTWASTYKIRGLVIILSKQVAASQTFDAVLYSSDGTTELQSVTYDSDFLGTTSTGSAARICEFYFNNATLSALNFGTKYFIFIRPVASTGDILINDFSVRQASDMQAFPLGENCFMASKVNTATAPADLTTRRPFVGLIMDDITAPSGGGGGTGIAALTGGGLAR